MDALSPMIVSLIFLGIAFWLLDRNKYARYMTKPVKRLTLALVRNLLAYVGKLLRKVVSLFDPYRQV